MPPPKRLCASTEAAPPEDTPARTLPSDLMLEIVSRTDAETLIRSAACCKPLRHDILSPDFIRHVCRDLAGGAMPSCLLLGFLHTYDKTFGERQPPAPFSLVQQASPAAASISEGRIVPLLSRGTGADLLARYEPVTSRGGLVVLRRRHIYRRWRTDICVYNPLTGGRAFFPRPPGLESVSIHMYVLLTAADGVGCPFLLLAADFTALETSGSVKIKTVSSDAVDGNWGPLTMAIHPRPPKSALIPGCAAVVIGRVIYWLMHDGRKQGSLILTYGIGEATAGSIELPVDGLSNRSNLHLTSSPDDRLTLLASNQFTVSVWLLLPTGAGWEKQAVIEAEFTLSFLVPELLHLWREIEFVCSWGRRGMVVLRSPDKERLVLLNLKTKEMRIMNGANSCSTNLCPYEVELASWLSAMKIFH